MNRSEPIRTDAQNKALWGAVSRLRKEQGLSADDAQAVLRGHVKAVSGQESTKVITVAQAATVLQRLERVTPNPKAARTTGCKTGPRSCSSCGAGRGSGPGRTGDACTARVFGPDH